MSELSKIPVTVITGFLGAGKTTLIRHLMANPQGKRLAVLVNEFGTAGVDGDILKSCADENCPENNIVELANGCICCTVADDFIPTIEALMALPETPEHILIETSGLALPKPLLKAFDWPAIRSRITVDGVIALAPADIVVASTAGNQIIAIRAGNGIVAAVAFERVVAGPAREPVMALFPDQGIVVIGANQGITPLCGDKKHARTPDDFLNQVAHQNGLIQKFNLLDVDQLIHAVGGAEPQAFFCQGDLYFAAQDSVEYRHVESRPTFETVIAGAAIQHVIAVKPLQGILPHATCKKVLSVGANHKLVVRQL